MNRRRHRIPNGRGDAVTTRVIYDANRKTTRRCGECTLEGIAALIRFSASKALHLMAPPLTFDQQWHEVEGTNVRPQNVRKTLEVLAGLKAEGEAK